MIMYSFPATLIVSLLGAYATYHLAHRHGINAIRAASLSSLLFAGLTDLLHNPWWIALQPAYFGSTFVAMSEPHRLAEKTVLLAALIFGIILYCLQAINFTHFDGGIGGTLGGTAFLACIIMSSLERAYLTLRIRLRHPKVK